MIQDLENEVTLTDVLVPVAKTADTDCTGVNGAGYLRTTYTVSVGAGGITFSGTNKIELELEESDDDATYTDCANAAITNAVTGTNTGTFAVIDGTDDDSQSYQVTYLGNKQYSRVVLNFSGTHGTGTPIGVVAQQTGNRYL